MQYSFVKACLLALAATSSVLADAVVGFNVITAPTAGETIEAGSIYTITWAASDPAAPISLVLLQGASNTTLEASPIPIASGISSASGMYEWSIPAEAGGFSAYGIRLELDSDPANFFQYSNPFVVVSASGAHTKTVQLSQISTSAAPTSTSAPAPIPTSTSTSTTSTSTSTSTSSSTSTPAPPSTSAAASSTVISSSAPISSSSAAPSTTAEVNTTVLPPVAIVTSVRASNSTLPRTTIATSTISGAPSSATVSTTPFATGAASSNALARGSGLVGALALFIALL